MKKVLLFLLAFLSFFIIGCKGEEEKVDLEKVYSELLSDVDLQRVTENLEFLTSVEDVTITWESNKPEVIDNNGKVTRTEEDVIVTIKVTLTSGEEKLNKEIKVKVLKVEETDKPDDPEGPDVPENPTDTSISIAEAKKKEIGEVVEIKGVVTGLLGNKVYIEDSEAAISLYNVNSELIINCKVGNEIKVKGTLGEYKGVIQITNTSEVVVVSENNKVNAAAKITSLSEMATYEYKKVSMEGLVVKNVGGDVAGSNNVSVTLLSGDEEVTLYISKYLDSAIRSELGKVFAEIKAGDTITINEAYVTYFNVAQFEVLSGNAVVKTASGSQDEPDKPQVEAAYKTGFENSEGFEASTTYNNEEIIYFGGSQQWGTYFGTASTTAAIAGEQSMQMRWYASKPDMLGYVFTNFDLEGVNTVKFNAANTNGLNVKVSYSTDGGNTWLGEKLFALTDTSTEYVYTFEATGKVRIKFALSLPETAPTATSRVYIDNVVISNGEVSDTPVNPEPTPDPEPVKPELTVSVNKVTLEEGKTFKLNVQATEGYEVVFANSDSTVVSLENGTITALKIGNAKITISLKDTDVVKEVEVIVVEKVQVEEGKTSDLLISEYYEAPKGNNKYIEIFNGTGKDVDLTGYSVVLYSNGATEPNATYGILELSGTIKAGEVLVVYNSSADWEEILATGGIAASKGLSFNGDDAVALRKNGNDIDVVGIVGEDPGNGWEVNGVADATKDHALIRKSSVVSPSATWSADEWEVTDNTNNIGKHSFNGEEAGSTPSLPVAPLEAKTIAEVKKSELGAKVLFKGTVTAIVYNGSASNAYKVFLQDETGGIALYNVSKDNLETLAIGKYVSVEGVLDEYKGALQVKGTFKFESAEGNPGTYEAKNLSSMFHANLENNEYTKVNLKNVLLLSMDGEWTDTPSNITLTLSNLGFRAELFISKNLDQETYNSFKNAFFGAKSGDEFALNGVYASYSNNKASLEVVSGSSADKTLIYPELSVSEDRSISTEEGYVPFDYNVTEGYDVEISVSDDSVIALGEGNTVKGLKMGTAYIYIKVKGFIVEKSIQINVTPALYINKSETLLGIGQTDTIVATTTEIVEWTSSDESIATVDENGQITAVGMGTAEITAKIKGYEMSRTVEVTVYGDIATFKATEKNSVVLVKGTIVKKFYNGSILKDSTGYTMIYEKGSFVDYLVGDEVIIRGTAGAYYGEAQIANPTVYETISRGNAVLFNYQPIEIRKDLYSMEIGTPVEMVGKLVANGNYIDIEVDGGKVQFYGLLDEEKAELEKYVGAIVTVKALRYSKSYNAFYMGYSISEEQKLETVLNGISIVKEAKENIVLPSSNSIFTEYVINWSSSNTAIIANDGTFTTPSEDTEVVLTATITKGGQTLGTKAFTVTAKKAEAESSSSITIDFTTNFTTYAGGWGNSYSERTVTNSDLDSNDSFTVVFSRASKQTGTITDKPVIASGKGTNTVYVTVTLPSAKITAATFDLQQWGSKTFTDICIEYNNGGEWVKCSDSITTPASISSSGIPTTGVSEVRISITKSSSSNVQVALGSVTLELATK